MPALYYMKHHAKREHARRQLKLAKTQMENKMLEYRTRGMRILGGSNYALGTKWEYDEHIKEASTTHRQLEQKIYMAQLACDTVCAQFPEEPPHTGPNFFGRLPPVLVQHVIAMMLEPKELAALIGVGRPYAGLVESYRPLRQFCFWYKGNLDVSQPWERKRKGQADSWFDERDRLQRWRDVDTELMQLVSICFPSWLNQDKAGCVGIRNANAIHLRKLNVFVVLHKVPVSVMLREIAAWKEHLAKQRQLK